MKETSSQETQQEFFSEFSPEPVKPERFTAISRTQKPIFLSVSIEQIILAVIVAILTCCLMFFFGIMRGKALASKEMVAGKPALVAEPVFIENKSKITAQTASDNAAGPVGIKEKALPVKPDILPAVSKNTPVSVPTPALNTKQNLKPDAAKPYTIQLVTYKKKELAEKEVSSFKKNGFYSFIIPSGEYFQVCVGQYANREEAAKDMKGLSAKYKGFFLRRK